MSQTTRGGSWFSEPRDTVYRLFDEQGTQGSDLSFRIAKHRDRSQAVRGGMTAAFFSITYRSFNGPRDDMFVHVGFRVSRRKP